MPTLTADPERTKEILAATDNLLRVHKDWEGDPEAPVYPTAAFEAAIEQCVEAVNRGDIPQRCFKLTQAVRELDVEWQIYANGQRRPDGTPYGSFWAAFREVIASRQIATPTPPRITEPVHSLKRQGVGDYQIAMHIYGHNGEGPFLRDGQVAFDLIEKEAAEPGSVLGKGPWIHPTERERVQMEREANSDKLSAMDDKIASAGGTASGPSEPHNPQGNEPGNSPKGNKGKGNKGNKEVSPAPANLESQTGNVSQDEIATLVRESQNADPSRSASDIVDHLREEYGLTVTAIQVAATLRPSGK